MRSKYRDRISAERYTIQLRSYSYVKEFHGATLGGTGPDQLMKAFIHNKTNTGLNAWDKILHIIIIKSFVNIACIKGTHLFTFENEASCKDEGNNKYCQKSNQAPFPYI